MKHFSIFLMMIILSLCALLHAEEGRQINTIFGISLPAHVKQIGENRFQSTRSYDDTKRDIAERLSKLKFIRPLGEEINLPNVRAIFYQNMDDQAELYAINIYLNVQTGLTEIFFVKRPTKTNL